MNTQELIPVFSSHIDGESIRLVNARELHAFLEVGKDFSTWIKDRINQYDFQADKDYIEVSPNSGENPKGGRPAIEYHITLDMGKELSMVERNEKGKQARRYFIACEKKVLHLKDSHIDELLATQRLLIESQQDQIAYIKQKSEEAVAKAQDEAKKAHYEARSAASSAQFKIQQLEGQVAAERRDFSRWNVRSIRFWLKRRLRFCPSCIYVKCRCARWRKRITAVWMRSARCVSGRRRICPRICWARL